MYVITAAGVIERRKFEGVDSLQEAVGGFICSVPLLTASGFACYVNDTGLLDGLPRNHCLEELTQHQPIHGDGVIVSHEEAGEDHLLGMVCPEIKDRLEAFLGDLCRQEKAGLN